MKACYWFIWDQGSGAWPRAYVVAFFRHHGGSSTGQNSYHWDPLLGFFLKGLGHEIEFKYLDKKEYCSLGLNKNLD